MNRIAFLLIAGALVLASAPPAHAQFGGPQKSVLREDFILPAGDVRILVFRPDVRVGEQTTGGMNEPKADWTLAARQHLVTALGKARATQGSGLVMVPEQVGDRAALLADYTALFKTVADAAFTHKLFPGNRLPTKKERFDWTLGEGAAALKPLGGDYGLFFYTYDSYGSTGRKVAQVLGAVMGLGLMSSGVHIGYAGLVDLNSGDLVWLNADTAMGGDVRTAEGADKRVAQLLDGFPLKGKGQVIVGEAPPAGSEPKKAEKKEEKTSGREEPTP